MLINIKLCPADGFVEKRYNCILRFDILHDCGGRFIANIVKYANANYYYYLKKYHK